ncbi:nitroreductase [Natranaerovirga hydrolytica]|uniref:Nitroreductase n=1 Tax=Natranaerovirga hydrolytica TaxID=680378 RepID=A0A4R1MJQ7_9FIRM|nr:nitroreductase family protein [Natranaerovirga hydrolytica]TCK92685.1 nitroreductase [Natranaerovirga hydrolytica]
MEDFFELVLNRESCRSYKGEPVKKEDLIKCIETARLAPSACNGQPWKFVIVTNDKIIEECVKLTQPFTKNAGAFIIIVEEKPSFQTKIVNKFKEQDYTQVDIGIVTSHICLAATELGMSTCMLGWFNEKKIKELLNISVSKRVRLVISVGYATNQEVKPKKRKDLSQILTFVE